MRGPASIEENVAAARAARVNGSTASGSREQRLTFLEALLTCDTARAAAELGVAWFVRAGVRELVVALVDHERTGGPRLVGAAAHGVPASLVGIDLDDREHVLVQVMRGGEPSVLAPESLGLAARGVAYPLPWPARDGADAVGVVVFGGASKDASLRWGVRFLGRKLADLAGRQVPGASRLGRERSLLKNVLDAVPDPVVVTDPAGRLLLANARGEIYLTADDAAEKPHRRAVAANHVLFAAALSRQDGAGGRRELSLVDPSDGANRRFELVSSPVDLPAGRAIVSVLRIAETAVRAERDRLDLILSSVADPIIVTDANGGTVMTNAPAARLFTAPAGSSPEEMQRARVNDAHLSAHVANLFALEPGGRLRGQVSLLDPKTSVPVPVEAVSGKLASPHGEVTAIVTILHDRTEALEKSALYEELKSASSALEDKVREATAELMRQNKLLHRQAIELEAASSAKSLFLANMSHELRTPLNAILGYTSMMREGVSGPVPAKLTRPLDRIDSNGHHLLTLINDILDIARIEAGKMPYNPTKFVAADLVKEVLAELEPLIVRSKLRVRCEVGKVAPVLSTDRAKVKQILVNLVSNALKFTPEGAVTISAQFHKRTGETWISVADTGIGIADADRDAVFEDFRQVDNSPTRPYGGTGLGLAICRRLANLLGGEMRLASKIDKGSTFTLVLPSRRSPPPSARDSQKTSAR